MKLSKLLILAAALLVLTNMALAAKLPLKKTLSAGQEVRLPVTKGKIIQVDSKNLIDGKSTWQGISYKKGKVIGDPSMSTYSLPGKGRGMTVKFSRTIKKADTLGIKVLKGRVFFKMEEIIPDPPDLKIKKSELKGGIIKGFSVEPDENLTIKITGVSAKPASGSFVLYKGEKPHKEEFKRIKYSVTEGKTKTWEFSEKNKINSIDIQNMTGTAKARIEQPKFKIPKSKVKKTTPEMSYTLNSAIFAGAFNVAKQMFAMGVGINSQDRAGNTPLFMACRKGDPEFVKYLLDQGAKPNIKNKRDSTAIIAAASNRDSFAELVPLLIEKGADVKVKAKDGTTVLWPLITKDEKEVLDIVKLVLSKGAEVDPEIEGGRTPLMFAAMMGNLNMAKLLIENGANVNAQSTDGETPLNLAIKEGHSEVINYLKSVGAK